MRKRPPFRRSKNRIIAGVCAGVSEWLGWEPLAGRLLFVLISVMSVGVPGIIVYLVLWTVMPGPEDADAG
jgi:phage shock protein PspC (stress-responsive transcriptional regulator)